MRCYWWHYLDFLYIVLIRQSLPSAANWTFFLEMSNTSQWHGCVTPIFSTCWTGSGSFNDVFIAVTNFKLNLYYCSANSVCDTISRRSLLQIIGSIFIIFFYYDSENAIGLTFLNDHCTCILVSRLKYLILYTCLTLKYLKINIVQR